MRFRTLARGLGDRTTDGFGHSSRPPRSTSTDTGRLFLPTALRSFYQAVFQSLPSVSTQSASRASVAASQTFPTFSQPSPAASLKLPARVCHRDDNTEDVPLPKRIRIDRGPNIPSRYVSDTYCMQCVDPSVVVLAYTRPCTTFILHGRNGSSPPLCLLVDSGDAGAPAVVQQLVVHRLRL
jgi:hypothetical protein